MNHSGDAAEQIVRISLEGIDYAIRITGSAAKNIAAFLLAAFKSEGTDGKLKLKGKERLVNMLKSGRETKIFAVKNSDLKQFAIEAKRYGVTYCVLKEKGGAPDSLVEIMVTDTDAGKISRIMDKLEFAAVDMASLEAAPAPAEREAPDVDDTDKLLDELFDENGQAKTDAPEAERAKAAAEQGTAQNPTKAGPEKDTPSEPRSMTPSESEKATPGIEGKGGKTAPSSRKPTSVRQFIRERTAQAAKKREDKQAERAEPDKKPKNQQKPNQHKQPQRGTRKKTNAKERG